jgi:hypothetical protein
MAQAADLFAEPPDIRPADVIATKLPAWTSHRPFQRRRDLRGLPRSSPGYASTGFPSRVACRRAPLR